MVIEIRLMFYVDCGAWSKFNAQSKI